MQSSSLSFLSLFVSALNSLTAWWGFCLLYNSQWNMLLGWICWKRCKTKKDKLFHPFRKEEYVLVTMILKDDLFRFLSVILQFSSQLLLQFQHMEWGTSAVSRWCEGNMFYLPIISASATGASWCKSNPEILPSPPLGSSVHWKITLLRKCQADTSSCLETECLQFCMISIHLIEMDGCLFMFLPKGKALESFPTLLLVRHFGFPLA